MDPIDPAIWATTQSSQSQSNPLWAGLKTSALGLASDVAGTYGSVGRFLGIPSLGNAGTNVASYLTQKAQEQGRTDLEKMPWEEGHGPLLPTLVYQAAKMAPALAGLALAPEIGVEGQIGKSLGMGAVALPFAPGQVYNAAGEKPGGATREDAAKALALSPVVAALNSFAPGLLMNGIGGHLIGNLASKVATKTVVGGFLAKAGAGALVDGAAGAIQGGASAALVQEAVRPDLTSQQKMANIVESTVTGGALGGLAGGVISGFRSTPGLDATRGLKGKPANDVTNDDLIKTLDAVHSPSAAEGAPPVQEQTPPPTQEQAPPPAPSPYAHLNEAELQQQYGQTYDYLNQHLGEKDQSQWTPQEHQLVTAHDELVAELSRRKANGSVTTAGVSPDAVGAVEQQPDVSGGVEPNLAVAPAPTTFNPRDFLTGISGRARTPYLEASSPAEMLKIAEEKASTSKSPQHNDIVERLQAALKAQEPPMTVDGYVDDYLAGRGRDSTEHEQFAANNPAQIEAEFRARKNAADTATAPDDLLKGVGDMPTREPAPAAVTTAPEPKSTANSRGGDQTLDIDFRAGLRKLIDPESGPPELKGALIKQVAQADPRNLADAQHVVMDLLGDNHTPSDGSTADRPFGVDKKDGVFGLQRLAQHLGLYDGDGKLTERGVEVARSQIPDQVVDTAASTLGHSDNSEAFKAGARGDSSKGLTDEAALAYKRGEQWALDRDTTRTDGAAAPIPRVAGDKATEESVAKNLPEQLARDEVDRKSVTDGIDRALTPSEEAQQKLNNEIDTVHGDGLKAPEVAQLKLIAARGDENAREQVLDAAAKFRAGETVLANEPPARPVDHNTIQGDYGQTVVADRTAMWRAREAEVARLTQAQNDAVKPGEKQAARDHAADMIRQFDTLADIRDAHQAGEISNGQAIMLRMRAEKGDIDGARKGLPERLLPSMHLADANGNPVTADGDRLAARRLISTASVTKNVHDVVQELVDQGGELGAIAKRFQDLVPDSQVRVLTSKQIGDLAAAGGIDPGPTGRAWGMFDHDTNTMYLAADMPHSSIAMHEITHSILDSHIHHDTPIGKEIKSIYARFERYAPPGEYAFTSPFEFMAEFLARKQMRDFVQKLGGEGKVGNIFQRTWAAIKQALGGTPTNYTEKLLKLAEAAGHSPLDTEGRAISPKLYTEKVKDTVEGVAKKADEIFKSVPSAVRSKELYWGSNNSIEEKYGHVYEDAEGRNGLRERNEINAMRPPSASMVARPANEFFDRQRALERSDPKAHASLQELLRLVYDGIHPTRSWAEQSPDVKSNPANKAAHIEAQAAMRRLQQRDFLNKNTDGVDTYMSMDKVSKTEKLRSVSDMMYKIAQNTPLSKGKLAEFAQHPLMDLRERSTRETFGVDNSYKYWNDKAEGMHYALQEFTAAQRAIADHPGTSNEERSAILSDIGTLEETVKLADKGLTRLAQGPNFSLGRIGDFFASAMLKLNTDGSIDRQALPHVQDHLAEFGVIVPLNTERGNIFMRVETEAQRDSLLVKMRELQAQGHLRADADTDTGSALKFGKRGDAAAVQLSKDIAPWLASFEASIRNNPDYTDASRKQLMEDMHSHMLDQMPDNSLAKFMAPRKSVGGFDANMIDNFMRRTRAANDAFVGRALSPMMADATAHMESRLDALQRSPTSSDATKQADIARDVLDEVRKRDLVIGQYTQTPVLDALRRVTNSFALGGTIAYPVVQLTQIGMVALPKLGAVHGFVKASKALARNTIEAARITSAMIAEGMDVKGLSLAQRLARASNVEVSLEALQRTGISARKAEYLMHLTNAGQLGTGSQAHLLVAASEGKTDGAFNHTMQYAASLGYYAETFTRILTGLAHLDLVGPEMSPRDASVGGIALNKASLFDFHQDVQGRAFGKQGIYGQVTPLMTQFMTYQSSMVQRLYLDVHKAFIDKTATPEDARQARAFLMQHAAMSAMFAGTLGMPFATAFAAAYDKLKDLMDGDEHPSDIRSDYRNYLANMFGKDAAEVIAKGGFRLAGVDMTNRIGEQDLLPFSKFISDRRALKDQFKDLEARSWGAPINLAINAIRGADKLMDGDVLGGLATMMPAAISNPIKAYRMTQDGYVDANGNKLPISTPSSEATLAQLLGFTPSAKAEYSEASLAQSQQKAILHNKGMSLSNQITQALQSGDHATARDAIAQTIAFDKANPTYAVLPALKSKMTSQAKSGAVASALHTPLGVNPRDLAGQSLTRYANY